MCPHAQAVHSSHPLDMEHHQNLMERERHVQPSCNAECAQPCHDSSNKPTWLLPKALDQLLFAKGTCFRHSAYTPRLQQAISLVPDTRQSPCWQGCYKCLQSAQHNIGALLGNFALEVPSCQHFAAVQQPPYFSCHHMVQQLAPSLS